MSALPETDEYQVATLRQEYEKLSKDGGGPASEACFRLVWGLVHSKKKADIDQGSQLASVLMQSDDMDAKAKKDLVYFQCVALYKLGKYVDAKRQLEEFLQVSPNHRQALSLKEAVDDRLVRDGLIGVGIASTVGVVIAGVLAAVLSNRR